MTDIDVAVVGSGCAGLAAAIAVRETGASVLLIEGADVLGGSTRLSGGRLFGSGTRRQKANGIEDDPEDMYRYYMALNQFQLEPAVVRTFVTASGPTVDWMEDLGVEFDPRVVRAGEESIARQHITIGEGQGIVDALVKEARRVGVEFLVHTLVDRLLVEDGQVRGVVARGEELKAHCVVLATGGFAANRVLVEKLLPGLADEDWYWYIGADTSAGTVFDLCDAVDAQIVGHGRCVLLPTPGFGDTLEGGYLPGWLVLVNGDGRRFFDETSAYSVAQPAIGAQPKPIYAVFDHAAKESSTPSSVEASKRLARGKTGDRPQKWVKAMLDEMVDAGQVHVADSLPELARTIGIDPDRLSATISGYNEGVDAGEDRQYAKNPAVLRRIDTGPFYATEVRTAHVALTCVGPRIDPQARVLNTLGRPVPNLFAAGECTGGVLGDVYVGSGLSITSAMVFGKIAGSEAARRAADLAAPTELTTLTESQH